MWIIPVLKQEERLKDRQFYARTRLPYQAQWMILALSFQQFYAQNNNHDHKAVLSLDNKEDRKLKKIHSANFEFTH